MKLTLSTSLALVILPFSLYADDSVYCPQNHAYINVGMTPDQVIAACGQPQSQQDSSQPVFQKVPVQQMIYNNRGATTAFYGVWNLPTGTAGSRVEINIVNKKVKSVKVNGSGSNSFSICKGQNIEEGDTLQKVLYSCGSPSVINNTFIKEVVPTPEKPKVWTYQPGQYQSPITLTFVNGRLQSIE